MKLFRLLLLISLAVVLNGASCQLSNFGQGQTGSLGVFKSFDSGKTWEQRVYVRQNKKQTETIAGAFVTVFRFDPNDSEKVYIGTSNMGLWVTENGSEQWKPLYPNASVQDVVVDGRSSIIYFATSNSIFKSIDNGKTWPVLYLETRKGVTMTALAINGKYDLYAGSSNGELLLSSDYGNSWKVVKRFDNPIKKIVVRPGNSTELFVATADRGIWRTDDAGGSWKDLTVSLEKQVKGAKVYRDMAVSVDSARIVYASHSGIVISIDNGETWLSPLNLLTAPDTVDISTLVVSARDPKIFWYTTGRTLYRTFSGGDRWETVALPGNGRPTALVAHPKDPGILYVGLSK